ncbi:acyl-CoA synthetase FdrA [Candidatus Bipolaricaulota bacterium]
MKTRRVAVIENRYFDSVFLMAMARRITEETGIENAAAVMGSDANKTVLENMGFDATALKRGKPHDLMVAIEGESAAIEAVLSNMEQWLARPASRLQGGLALSLDDALAQQPNSNLAVISVPGEYAAQEAHEALERGLNVFLFSDHVSVEDELALKRKASQSDLLVMGPDCGTALIAGTGVGFANVVRQGPIGVIASSGTGLQEFTSLVHRAGSGISHGIGTGGRDLTDAIGGLSTLSAITALEDDPGTAVIAIVSKPPGKETLEMILARLESCSKPAVACLLGIDKEAIPTDLPFGVHTTIDEAVEEALKLADGNAASNVDASSEEMDALLESEAELFSHGQRYIRGLFAGGTFCYQAQQVMKEGGVTVHSNAPLPGMEPLGDQGASEENTLIDMGADEFTVGMPHPMIDATQRRKHIGDEARDSEVGVLLLDIVLGYNASPDPAGDLAEAIVDAKHSATEAGRHLTVVASICGTDLDPQGLEAQEQILQAAGAIVFPSNAQASQFALELHKRLREGG